METGVVWMSFVIAVLGVVGLVLLVYRFGMPSYNLNFEGIWLNESLNIRILLHNDDSSVFQGLVVWANGMDKLLGFKMVENLRFDKSSRNGRGKYADPLTGKVYEITLCMKRKGLIRINAYHPNSNSLAFSQEWVQFTP